LSRDLVKFWKIIHKVSETVHDTDVVTTRLLQAADSRLKRYTTYLIIVMTLSVLQGSLPIASLFNISCAIFRITFDNGIAFRIAVTVRDKNFTLGGMRSVS